MFEELFATGDSFLHKTDARTKIVLAFLIILAIISTHTVVGGFIFFMAMVLYILFARISLREVAKRLLVANTFILFLWLFIPFSTPGTPLFRIYKLTVTQQGLYQSLLITLKSNAALLSIIAFINTTPIPLLGYGLSKLKIPPKFTLLFLLTYRYLSVIFEEFERLMQAAKIRNFVPRTNMHTYKTISYLFAMILIRSYERGKRVYNAMLLRGFNGTFHSLYETEPGKYDIILTLVTISLMVGGILLDRYLCYIHSILKGHILWNHYLN